MPYRKMETLEYSYISSPYGYNGTYELFTLIGYNILNPLEQKTAKVECSLNLNGEYPRFYEFKDNYIKELEAIAGELTRDLQKVFLENPNDVERLEIGYKELKNNNELQERMRKTVPEKFDIKYLRINLCIVDDIFWLKEEIEHANA